MFCWEYYQLGPYWFLRIILESILFHVWNYGGRKGGWPDERELKLHYALKPAFSLALFSLSPIIKLPIKIQLANSCGFCRPHSPSFQLLNSATIAWKQSSVQFRSAAQSCLSLRPHGLQHARLPCPSPTPRVCSNPCPWSRWCPPAVSSSVVPSSSCPQSLPASGASLSTKAVVDRL